MNKSPAIVMTRLDVQRLEKVLDNMQAPLDLLEALEDEVLRARVVSHKRIASDVVTMNSTVRFIDEASEREFVLTLVYPEQAGRPGTISILAPVGIALLGLKVGQSINWQGPQGRPLKLKIMDIVYQPEASGDFHL
ncbi:nucleoside diphosphate kinase regulator [Pseudomonas neustonica]|uniref:Nucleoside diphosphate kinase regulator n=1 Tax=Pseudomonas neustonica TaxID=2487346 RepID=A0ABX9XKI2_9PSED|nr:MULTISPECIES: nucleoside diphosphate kinase regulator [Pseudomonas]MAB23659.1 nucleoside diphosphate kinase regulator [Pseudomonadales bacterium]MBA6421014.1 nucleoside diphosphate kinase regulator [Pseudomonas sp. 5Ae-yellow]ROZ82756.1 nucleoside diphosphate kinase regulator [Pseudomonas sp. SSM44]ROZ84708.1 nucleoside diphosphate kinase regulator [Pseudomonas neustonica]|tara:strand:- start:3177 stop:3584 length:408 start_codon:yes stop_codon:yes gene_type:complete